MKCDEMNKDVLLRESDHVYENINDPSIQYSYVTTLIGKYDNEFDKELESKYKALENFFLLIFERTKKEEYGSHKILKEFLEVYNISEEQLNKT